MFDPTNAQGHITSPGGFQLVKGARSVPITDVEVEHRAGLRPRERSPAPTCSSAPSPTPTTGREGFGARIKAGQLTLTQKAATRISNKLGLQGSQRINQRVMSNEFSITVAADRDDPRPERSDVGNGAPRRSKSSAKRASSRRAGSTRSLRPNSSKVANFTFPITGGIVAPNVSSGSVTTAGGVEILKKGKTLSPQMKITNVQLEFAQKTATVEIEILPNPPFPGRPAGPRSSNWSSRPTRSRPTRRRARSRSKGPKRNCRLRPRRRSTRCSTRATKKRPRRAANSRAGELFGTFSMTLQAQ